MPPASSYTVRLEHVAPRDMAAVRARVDAAHVGATFRAYLDQVYAAAGNGALALDGQNIFVYRSVDGRPDQLDVEFGVGTQAPFAATGNVAHTTTPHGEAATTTHWGDYRALGEAHAAVVGWCRSNGVPLAGPRWEVYGHWRDGETPRTDIYYLVAPRA